MQWIPLTIGVLLVLASLPVVIRLMMPPLPPDRRTDEPACVVVFGAGRRNTTDGVQLSARSLSRLQVAVSLAKRESLPLLVSGGAAGDLDGESEATLMTDWVRRQTAGVTVWQENTSQNTAQNASECARLLTQKQIKRVFLVTDKSHLCRALLCLKKQGVTSVPHATRLMPHPVWLPHIAALRLWPELVYEWAALCWYFLLRRL